MIKGKNKFKINERITIGMDDNAMHWAEIRDEFGDIERVITRKTSNELWKELMEVIK
jgi:hypothetical protein